MSIHQDIYGNLVEIDDDLLGIVETIHRLWPTLRVVYLDPEQHHDVFDAPFRILERCKDGVERKVMDVWHLDNTVLDKLKAISRNDEAVNLEKLLAEANAKAEKAKRDKFNEALGAAHDVAAHALRHPATSYSFKNDDGDIVTISDDDPVKKKSTTYDIG